MSDLRDRIAAALKARDEASITGISDPFLAEHASYDELADAVIAELDLGIPCAANGCKVRRIAKYHAEKSSQLSKADDD